MRPPIHITDLDLSGPLRPLDGLDRFTAVRALVRLHGEPLGEITLPIVNGGVTAHALAEAIRTALYDPLLTACLRNGIQAPVGPDDLRQCLTAIAALTYPHIDVLVVDNAASDNSTRALVATAFPEVRYVEEPRPGLDWARNRAILEARGEILAFTDDDVVVDPDWVSALVPVFAAAPDVMCVNGLVLPHELETEAQLLFEQCGGFARGFQRCWYRRPPRGTPEAILYHHGPGRFGTGANMAFRRTVFDDIGPFDPALDVGTQTTGGGDLEMYFRVLQEGHTLVYEPRALVRHRHRRTLDALYRQIGSWGRATFAIKAQALRRYPEERAGFRTLARWWRGDALRRLKQSLFGRNPIPAALVWADIRGALDGARSYRRARVDARAIEAEFGPQRPHFHGDSLPSPATVSSRSIPS